MRKRVVLMALGVTALLYAQANPVPPSVAQIVSAHPDGLGNIVACLENTGTKTITGFVFEKFGPQWGETWLKPGASMDAGSWSVRNADNGKAPIVLAVIFSDGTSMGDPVEIRKLWERRRGMRDEYARWSQLAARMQIGPLLAAAKPLHASNANAYEQGRNLALKQLQDEAQYRPTGLSRFLRNSLAWAQTRSKETVQ